MRVLFFDPGAERLGWAVLEGDAHSDPQYIDSGILRCPKEEEERYQHYKLRLIRSYVLWAPKFFNSYRPDVVGNEIVPSQGFNNMSQAQLAQAVVATIQAMAYEREYKVVQVGATTIKKAIGGHKQATKIGIRNGVIKLLPNLADRKSEWTKVFDESDALAGGLAYLGYCNPPRV